MANTKDGDVWTDEELKLAYDTDCPLTLAGERRCAYRYKGIDWRYDEYGMVVVQLATSQLRISWA
jgi:hypothetical protein